MVKIPTVPMPKWPRAGKRNDLLEGEATQKNSK